MAGLTSRRAFVPAALVLVAIRFGAPTLLAYLGVRGVDTPALDAAFELYAGILPPVLFVLVVAVLLPAAARVRWTRWLVAALGLTVAALALWLGEVFPDLRIAASAWTGLVLGVLAGGAIAAFERSFEGLWDVSGGVSLEGFRALGAGFAVAYILESLRLVDYRYSVGVSLPSGVLWALDYGPILVLSFLSLLLWFRISVPAVRTPRDELWAVLPPILVAGLGAAVAAGVGRIGFILSNALAWGGGYAIFSPTFVSLGLVGLATGAFFSVARVLRARMPPDAWRFVAGGIGIACLAGILPFGGVGASFAGIVLGLACVARGLGRTPSRPS